MSEDRDRQPPAARPRPRPRPSPLAVLTTALGLFFVVLTLLAIQVRNGRDPALGPGPAVRASQPASRHPKATAKATAPSQVVSRTSPTPP